MEPAIELNEDILLSSRSVSSKNGHFGSSTEYIAATHQVVYRTWGARRRLFGLLPPRKIPPVIQHLDIPPEITSEDGIRRYVMSRHRHWLRR